MRAIANEAWASRLGWLLKLTLPAFATWTLFLAPLIAIVVVVFMILCPTLVVARPLVLELGGVFGERLRNGDGVVKCLNHTPIKLGFGSILEAILKVEERILVGHDAYLQHKGSELVDVVLNTTRLLEET